MITINNKMRMYDYYCYGELDSYGQPRLSENVQGQVKMAIYNTATSINDTVKYTGEDYVGITWDKDIDDTYVIQYGDERLKVLYTVRAPRMQTQVFMTRV